MKSLKMLLGIVFLLALGQPSLVTAQNNDEVTLSLEQAREYALQHNINMRNVRADLEIARKSIWEITASGLPQISGSLGYQYYVDIPTSLVPAEFFGGEPGE
ncbi:MAG: TolC family protein, partial [Bacteroidales bacterium]